MEQRFPSPGEVGAATTLATIGALPLGQVPEEEEELDYPPQAYALGSVVGAGLGGGLVGYVAAGDLRGASAGALLTGGLAGAVNGVHLLRKTTHKSFGAALGFGSLVAMGIAVYLGGSRSEAT